MEIDNDVPLKLESAKKGLTQFKLYVHSRPAVYILYHESSGKYYIGSTKSLYYRMKQHVNSLRVGQHRTVEFQEVYDSSKNKNLRASFMWAEDREHAYDLEQLLLNKYLPSGKLLNNSPHARVSNKGLSPSKRVRDILRAKTLQRFENPVERAKLSEIAKNLWKQPEYLEKQAKAAAARTGKESIRNREAMTRAWSDPIIREKFLKIRAKRRRPISIDGVRYSSMKEAAEILNIPVTTIFTRLNRRSENFKTYFYTDEGNTENGTN